MSTSAESGSCARPELEGTTAVPPLNSPNSRRRGGGYAERGKEKGTWKAGHSPLYHSSPLSLPLPRCQFGIPTPGSLAPEYTQLCILLLLRFRGAHACGPKFRIPVCTPSGAVSLDPPNINMPFPLLPCPAVFVPLSVSQGSDKPN